MNRCEKEACGFAQFKRAVCLYLLCGLCLCGCGKTGNEPMFASEETETEDVRSQEETGTAEEAGAGSTARERLEELVEDEGFRECLWHGAGLEETDTKDDVYQKLIQCESLTIETWPDIHPIPVFSIESLELVPNLKSLTVDISDWESSRILDFSPIAGISRLETLMICYDTGEEIDLPFLSGMDTVGKLENLEDLGLQGCGLTDIGFLRGLAKLRKLNLNGNAISDLAPLSEVC